MIKVFVFLRKPAASHPLPFINISQRNVSSKFFPKHSAHLNLGNMPRKLNPVLM